MSDAEIAYAAAQEAIREAADLGNTSLNLSGLKYQDLRTLPSEISGLKSLVSLSLNETRVSDLSLLQHLTSLSVLQLNDTDVADLGPLSAHMSLAVLTLNNTQILDLSSIQHLRNIRTINIDNTNIIDLAPVRNFIKLETIMANNTRVASVSPLRALTKLNAVGLANTSVVDLAPLQALTRLQELYLDNTQVTDLAPLSGLQNLEYLTLNGTPVADLSPLSLLSRVALLELADTPIRDLVPLQNHPLQRLVVENTPNLSDLRPIKDATSLIGRMGEGNRRGLYLRGCAACGLDPHGLGELAEIHDVSSRTEKTLSYLRELTEWPPSRVEAPEQDDVLQVAPNDDGKLDIVPTYPGAGEASERLKRALFLRLQQAFEELARATGNQQPEVSRRARAAGVAFQGDFARVDLIQVYLEVAWVRSELDRRGERQGEHRFSNAAVAALDEIVTIGPGLVLDNPEVEKLEERRRRFEAHPLPPEVAAAQNAVADRIAGEFEAFGDRLRNYARAGLGAISDASDRRRLLQRPLVRNTVIAVGVVVSGVVGGASYDAAKAAVRWALDNEGIIRTAALGWGDMFLAWLGPVIEQARAIAAAAQSSGAIRPTHRERGPQ